MARMGTRLIRDGIVYHFSHFRKLLTLESDTFDHKMSLSQVTLVQCSPAMAGFSSDKINILQHIKCLFSTISLKPGTLDGINMVIKNEGIKVL